MRKQLNTLFIKQLIDLDFPFVKTLTKYEKVNSVTARLNLNTKNQFHILDLFTLNNSLKQFIRILYSLKEELIQGDKAKFYIYIWCSNKFILDLVQIFITQFHLKPFIILCDLFPNIDVVGDFDKQRFLFVLGDPWTERSKEMLRTRVVYNKIFLVNSLTFKNDKPQLGLFKIQNDLADYKKLLVLLTIIDKVIGDHKILTRTHPEE